MTKRMKASKKNIMDTYTMVKEKSTQLCGTDMITYKQFQEAKQLDGVPVIYDPCVMYHYGAAFAAATAVIFPGEVVKRIIVHDAFFEMLSEDTKKFTMYHEIGHLENNDLEKMSKEKNPKLHQYKRLFGKGLEMEFEADTYAAKIVGKEVAVKALVEIWKSMGIVGAIMNAKEIRTRINHIKELR